MDGWIHWQEEEGRRRADFCCWSSDGWKTTTTAKQRQNLSQQQPVARTHAVEPTVCSIFPPSIPRSTYSWWRWTRVRENRSVVRGLLPRLPTISTRTAVAALLGHDRLPLHSSTSSTLYTNITAFCSPAVACCWIESGVHHSLPPAAG